MLSPSKAQSTESTFAEATTVSPIAGRQNEFAANIPWDWSGGTNAHGGYVASVLLSTARAYFRQKNGNDSQPDPVASHTQFLYPVTVGPATLMVRELIPSKSYPCVQVELQKEQKDKSMKTCVIAIITQNNLATESGQTIETPATVSKAELPDRETECYEHIKPDYMKKMYPVSTKTRTFYVNGGKNGRLNDRKGLHVREIWLGWTDPNQFFDVISVATACDMFLSAPTNFYDYEEDIKGLYVYPTLSLSVDIKKDPKDSKWLYMKIRTHKILNGRFDQEVQLIDEEGDLVALSKHVSRAVPLKGNKTQLKSNL